MGILSYDSSPTEMDESNQANSPTPRTKPTTQMNSTFAFLDDEGNDYNERLGTRLSTEPDKMIQLLQKDLWGLSTPIRFSQAYFKDTIPQVLMTGANPERGRGQYF
jgi:hypothetical protein